MCIFFNKKTPKIMSNHINAVSTSKQLRKKFCQITNLVWQKNYVKSQWCLLFTSNKWDFTKFMWNQSNLCFYVKAIWFDRKKSVKNYVKPMQCSLLYSIDWITLYAVTKSECVHFTVWKFQDFSIIQILCEINFRIL